MTHLDLCTGIGGFHLAAAWAGFDTIGFSEIDPYCCRLLAEKWPEIPNYGDLRTANFSELRGKIDVLSAGVPCQPSSLAGKRRGEDDDRWLWTTVLDVVGRVEPAWCIFENPVGILSLDEFSGVLLRLESLGYEVRAFSVPANAVGAKHRRQRIFIVANRACELRNGSGHAGPRRRDESANGGKTLADTGSQRCTQRKERNCEPERSGFKASQGDDTERCGETLADAAQGGLRQPGKGTRGPAIRGEGEALSHADSAQWRQAQPGGNEHHGQETGRRQGADGFAGICDSDASDSDGAGLEERQREPGNNGEELSTTYRSIGGLTQPPLCRRADGLPNRSHRLKALGNAVVPQQAYPFFEAIAQTMLTR